MEYQVSANTRQELLQEVLMIVEAPSRDRAVELAEQALQEHPSPVTTPGIKRLLVTESIARSPDIEIQTIKEVRKLEND